MNQRVGPRLLAGRYECGELLGRGGMASVHAGTDLRLQRPVAIKTLRPEMSARPDIRTRFEIEARSAASLSHPNAVAVFDTGEHDGTPFIVMERLPGETLGDRMAAGAVDPGWLRQVALDVLGALAAAHARGLVHRDVKPGNILLTADGRAKVADFGIAKSLDRSADTDLTGTGLLVGTPAYLAPERLDGAPASPAGDLYALGVVLYEALAGRKPFEGDTALTLAYNIAHSQPPPLSSLRTDLDPGIVAAVERAMARRPEDRYAGAGEMAAALLAPAEPAGGADPTTVAGGPGADGPDPTAVLVAPAAAPATAPATAPAPPSYAPGRPARLGIAALVVILAAGIGLALSGDGDGTGASDAGREALAADMREVAARVETGDGPRGTQAAGRLRDIAGDYAGGSDVTSDAESLIGDARAWNERRELFDTATRLVVEVLSRIPGVSVPPTVAVTAPPAPPPTDPPEDRDEDRDEDRGEGKGRAKGRGRD